MKKRPKIGIYLLLFSSFLLVEGSCKKDDNNDPKTVSDIDGNVYNKVTIGAQVWLVENLKTTKFRDGTVIPLVTENGTWAALSSGAYCNYENSTNNVDTYGHMYNWYAVNDSRKICPTGWHVPSDAEWTELIGYLGGVSVAGGKLKEDGTTHWNDPNTGATNETNFTALPGGYRFLDGTFSSIGYYGWWWSATESDATNAWFCNLGYSHNLVGHDYDYKRLGFSVRCLKD